MGGRGQGVRRLAKASTLGQGRARPCAQHAGHVVPTTTPGHHDLRGDGASLVSQVKKLRHREGTQPTYRVLREIESLCLPVAHLRRLIACGLGATPMVPSHCITPKIRHPWSQCASFAVGQLRSHISTEGLLGRTPRPQQSHRLLHVQLQGGSLCH